MIFELLKKIDEKLDKHIDNSELHGKGLTVKEWGIIAGIVTTVCGTVTGIVTIFIQGGGS